MKSGNVKEKYQRLDCREGRQFDIQFWQSQGDSAIFEAALDMVRDYLLIRGKDADELRIQRTVETFRKI